MRALGKIVYAILFLLLTACGESNYMQEAIRPTSEVERAKYQLFDIMHSYYLWYDKIPSNINPDLYPNPEKLLDGMRYNLYDRWSFVDDYDAFMSFYREGKMVGYGLMFMLSDNYEFYVAFIYNSSSLYPQGVRRGWRLDKVNNTKLTIDNYVDLMGPNEEGYTCSFGMIDPAGTPHTFEAVKKEITINTVLHYSVIHNNSTKLGYLVLESFLETTEAELNDVFSYFQSQGITELILDMRYNGGGSVDVSNYLASSLAPAKTAGNVYLQYVFNNKHSEENFSLDFKTTPYNLNLNRLFVLTTHYTASASEAVINGLKPFIPVYTIGQKTNGKPVGMYSFSYYPYVFLPVIFETFNAQDEGRYYQGIPVNANADDGFRYDFGDTNDGMLAEVIYYLNNGVFFNQAKSLTPFSGRLIQEGQRHGSIMYISSEVWPEKK